MRSIFLATLTCVGGCGSGGGGGGRYDFSKPSDAGAGGDLAGTVDDMAMQQSPDLRPPPPSCNDGRLNGDESDVDCGGSCMRCADGRSCRNAADCASNNCLNFTCAPAANCMDFIKNGN